MDSTSFFDIPIYPEEDIVTDFIELSKEGRLVIKEKYAWDGATFAWDWGFKIASLVHDSLYQLIRKGLLDKKMKLSADLIYENHAKVFGKVWPFRRYYALLALLLFGNYGLRKNNKVYILP